MIIGLMRGSACFSWLCPCRGPCPCPTGCVLLTAAHPVPDREEQPWRQGLRLASGGFPGVWQDVGDTEDVTRSLIFPKEQECHDRG